VADGFLCADGMGRERARRVVTAGVQRVEIRADRAEGDVTSGSTTGGGSAAGPKEPTLPRVARVGQRVDPAPLEVRPRRTSTWVPARTGFLLVGRTARLICANAEGLRVLVYPEDTPDMRLVESSLKDRLPSLLAGKRSDRGESFAEIRSGRRRYQCCLIAVTVPARGPAAETIALLMERRAQGQLALRRVSEEFKLTPRERESVQLLAQGLTNKEIADRMGLSPNTVKTLLRMLMTKLAAPSRSAVIVKLFGFAQPLQLSIAALTLLG
jgi:DNA-binding CsgD family transcriptional regulator